MSAQAAPTFVFGAGAGATPKAAAAAKKKSPKAAAKQKAKAAAKKKKATVPTARVSDRHREAVCSLVLRYLEGVEQEPADPAQIVLVLRQRYPSLFAPHWPDAKIKGAPGRAAVFAHRDHAA